MDSRYSHRQNPDVPAFADDGHVVLMDGSCGFCSRSARSIAKADLGDQFKIATVQSPLGRAVLTHYNIDPDDPVSWLYLREGEPLEGSDAIIAAASHLSGPASLLKHLRLIPRPIREAAYRFIARHRYKLMGRGDLCALPDQALRERLL